MVLTLKTMAYVACTSDMKKWYNSGPPGLVKVDIKRCCTNNIESSKIRRRLRPKDIKTCRTAAYFGHIECLKMAVSLGAKMTPKTAMYAARRGNLDCLEYAVLHGCEIYEQTGLWAIAHGQMESLKFLLRNGWKCSRISILTAAQSNLIDMVRFLRSLGCPWLIDVTYTAAMRGNIELLKYAHQDGCEMHHCAAMAGFYQRNFECTKYAYENGAVLNEGPPTEWYHQMEALQNKKTDEQEVVADHTETKNQKDADNQMDHQNDEGTNKRRRIEH